MSSKVKSIKAREILDSRGNWTVEVDLATEKGLFRDSAPSGASRGKHEAKTVDSKTAIKNINNIVAPRLRGKDVTDQRGIDKILKELNVGANATTPVSMAFCRAGATSKKVPLWKYVAQLSEVGPRPILPKPCFNIINGGVHANNDLDFQEFMVVCSIQKASEIYQRLREKLGKNVGDEGGFAPPFQIPEQALELLVRTFLLREKRSPQIIIDVAASQFYVDGKYKMRQGVFTKEGLIRYYQNLIKKYPIIGLEDPFAEDDEDGWREIGRSDLLIFGDDLLVTNPERIKMAKEKNLCNGLLLKINQIGNITEALEAARLARSYGWKIMVSHRSGETNDDFIADFAVGIGADYLKSGAPARGERTAKYNRLLRIGEELKL